MQQKTLSNLEKEVMDIIWQKKESSVRDLVNELQKKRKIAYTTVATIVQRLENKELVVRREEGKTNFYKSKLTKESYTKRIAQGFVRNFVQSFGNTAVASFADSIDDLPADKRESLLKLLLANDKNKH
jgi:predicted transcriptional regulator